MNKFIDLKKLVETSLTGTNFLKQYFKIKGLSRRFSIPGLSCSSSRLEIHDICVKCTRLILHPTGSVSKDPCILMFQKKKAS